MFHTLLVQDRVFRTFLYCDALDDLPFFSFLYLLHTFKELHDSIFTLIFYVQFQMLNLPSWKCVGTGTTLTQWVHSGTSDANRLAVARRTLLSPVSLGKTFSTILAYLLLNLHLCLSSIFVLPFWRAVISIIHTY